MFQQLEEQQKEIRAKLAAQQVQTESGEGLVQVTMNGNKEVLAIALDRDHPDFADAEAVEDHLIVALNEAIQQASALEQQTVQEFMAKMLPGGLGGLGNLFGG